MSIEIVLLIEPDGHQIKLRPWNLPAEKHITEIVEQERPTNSTDKGLTRFWRCVNGERALSGQRVFREVLPPAPVEPAENPIFQERVIKEPLKFYDDETPNGFRRKYLRKA